MAHTDVIKKILFDPVLMGIKSIADSLLKSFKKKPSQPDLFVNLIKPDLEKEINQIVGKDVLTLVKKSGLGKVLNLKHGINLNLYKDNTVKCEFTKQIDKDSLMKNLQGIKELDQACYELLSYEPSKDIDQIINLLKKFFKEYPSFKNYPSSYQCTLLYAAATTNFLGAAEVLVNDFKCMIDLASGKDERTPALQAITYKNMQVYKFLVAKGADRTKVSLTGSNAFFYEELQKWESDPEKDLGGNEPRVENSPYKWQYSIECKEFKDFKKAECEKIQERVLSGEDKLISLNDDPRYEYKINIKEFHGIYTDARGEQWLTLRYVEKPPSQMFCIKSKKDRKRTAIKWQLIHEKLGILDCDEDKNKQINDLFFGGQLNAEIHFEFPRSLTAESIDINTTSKKFGEPKTSSFWLISLDLAKFKWSAQGYKLSGDIRWIPWLVEELTVENYDSRNSTQISSDSEEEDIVENTQNDAKNFLEQNEKEEAPKSNKYIKPTNERVFIDKGSAFDNIKNYFPDEKIIRDGDNIIVYGSPELQCNVERVLNFLVKAKNVNLKSNRDLPNLEIGTYIKKGHLHSKLEGFIICERPIFVFKKGADLQVEGTLDQLAEVSELIELLEKSLGELAREAKIFKRCFLGVSYLVEDLREDFEDDDSLQIIEDEDNVEVSGTLFQLTDVANKIDEMKKSIKNKNGKVKKTISHAGFLAEKLNSLKIHEEEIQAYNKNGDLRLECTERNFRWIESIVPFLKIQHENEQKILEIGKKIKNIEGKHEETFKLKLFTPELFYSINLFLTQFIETFLVEQVKVAGNTIIKKPYLKFKEENFTLNITVESAFEEHLGIIKEQIESIAKCFKIARDTQFSYQNDKRKSLNWIAKFFDSKGLVYSKRALWEKFKGILEVRVQDVLNICQNKLDKALVKQLLKTLQERMIDDETLKSLKDLCEKDRKESKVLEVVQNEISLIAKDFIKKMKDEVINELKENKIDISFKNIKVLDQMIKDMLPDMNKIIENPFELYDLFYRVELLLKGFKLNLPIFQDLPEFFDKLKNNKLVLVKASTGSGKSTLIPPLLLALGHKKIVVTQPRRLPCKMISKRVNETFDKTVSGWAVSGQSKGARNGLIYLTDGLLKEIIMYKGQNPLPYDVIMLDEIHERGQNVDLCIALLSLRINNPQEKFKLILCSATIDQKILDKFKNIPQGVFDITFQNNKIVDSDPKGLQPIHLAAELSRRLKGDQQLLCFLPSTADVKEAVKVFNEKFHRTAYPLLAATNSRLQELYLKDGQVFFSTTVAETSLTFKNLVFVIDSAKIRMPNFDYKLKVDVLQESEAAKSTSRQRRGRLGRTECTGNYFTMKNIDDLKLEYPISELEKINLTDAYFNLLRVTKDNKKAIEILNAVPISDLQQANFQAKIKFAIDELIQLDILDSQGRITNDGKKILDLPVRGQAKMAKAVFAGLTKYDSGQDLIILSAFILVLGPSLSVLLNNMPLSFKSKDGDYASLVNLMHAILQKRLTAFNNFDVLQACQELNIPLSIQGLVENCYKKYIQYDEEFANTPYRTQATLNNNWENIAKALLEGFYNHAFVNMKHLGGSDLYYLRLDGEQQVKGILAFDSTLSRKPGQEKETFILAKDISFIQYGEHRLEAGTLSFAGRLEKSWITYKIKRQFKFDIGENIDQNLLQGSGSLNITKNNLEILFHGSAGEVIDREHELDKTLRIPSQFIDLEVNIKVLIDTTNEAQQKNRYKENFEQIKTERGQIFKPLFWRWQNEQQVQFSFHSQSGKIEVKNARIPQFNQIQKQINQFISWFRNCNVIRNEESKVYPQTLDITKLEYVDIRARIERITNPKKDAFELLEYAVGPKANRTTRMELVAWILINEFGCIVEGGFVRDWIVGGRSNFPPGTTLQINPFNQKKDITNELVSPKDIDAYLPIDATFDSDKLRKMVSKYEMSLEVDSSDGWRHYLIFDENAQTGPFTVDLIEPFASACHDMIDMDVSNLYVKSGFTGELGMRISLDRVKPLAGGEPVKITLQNIIQNIKEKKFQVLRSAGVTARILKMKNRGWTEGPIKYESVLPTEKPGPFTESVKYPNDEIFKYAVSLMQPLGNPTIVKVVCLTNDAFDKIYEGQRELIKRFNDNQANEKILFHGTSQKGAEGIMDGNFDNRYFNDGLYGYGAYFADDPRKSLSYAPVNDKGEKIILICKVLLGKEQIVNQTKFGLRAPDRGFDSVISTGGFIEYIVYRFGQAKPFLMVVFK